MKTSHINIKRFSLNTIIIFITVAAFGPLIFSFLYGNTHIFFLPYLTLIKDAVLYFLLLCSFLCFLAGYLTINKKRFSLIVLFMLFIIFVFCSWLVTRGKLYNTALILRRFITPLLSVLIFSGIDLNEKQMHKFLKYIFYLVVIFGLFEYFFLDADFWNNVIKLPEYWANGALYSARLHKVPTVESTYFYSHDLRFITGDVTRRMLSGFTEPTTLASFLITGHILFSNNKRRIILNLLIIICGFLTISKAAVLVITGVLPLIKLFKRLLPGLRYSIIFILFYIILYIVAFLFVYNGLFLGPFSHISGYYTGVNILLSGKIFGLGIAKAGNFSDEVSMGGGESGCGGMLAQTGIGALIFIAFFYQLIRLLEEDEKSNRSAILMILAWTFIFVFSESSFGISGNFLFWAYPGMALYKTIHRKVLE